MNIDVCSAVQHIYSSVNTQVFKYSRLRVLVNHLVAKSQFTNEHKFTNVDRGDTGMPIRLTTYSSVVPRVQRSQLSESGVADLK